MNGFLLDTNILSELIKPKPEPRVLHWIAATDEDLLFLSVLKRFRCGCHCGSRHESLGLRRPTRVRQGAALLLRCGLDARLGAVQGA
jgi:predicted nucleic acid-binding protein